MSTLFQLQTPINSLKAMVRELALYWHPGDSILLLGETAAYHSWLTMYIEDLNYDEEFESNIDGIDAIYVLSDDLDQLNENAKLNSDYAEVKTLTDKQWVALTQQIDRVITLNSVS